MVEEQYWRAVLARDRTADGTFVYAVRSTRIYCRPSCPSRRPGREQVVFFPQPAAAEQAGFAACRRCRPQAATTPEPQTALVQQACAVIAAHLDELLTLDALGQAVGASPYYVQRIFKRLLGITPRQYAAVQRLDRLKAQLREGETVTNALYEAGYGGSSRLYEHGTAQLGMTPATYRRGGAGMEIAYTIVDSPLGRLLVAATARGVCAVSLGDTDAALAATLQQEYPAAAIYEDALALDPWVSALLAHLAGAQPHLDLPLDVQGTAFQWRVWAALQAIPYGSTRSYGDLAAALGQPTAARAVAQACATNPVALLIPCHRAVAKAGGPGGYRWGVARKQALLAQESEAALVS